MTVTTVLEEMHFGRSQDNWVVLCQNWSLIKFYRWSAALWEVPFLTTVLGVQYG